MNKPKLYCGDKTELPVGYDGFGSRMSCLRKGFGAGSYSSTETVRKFLPILLSIIERLDPLQLEVILAENKGSELADFILSYYIPESIESILNAEGERVYSDEDLDKYRRRIDPSFYGRDSFSNSDIQNLAKIHRLSMYKEIDIVSSDGYVSSYKNYVPKTPEELREELHNSGLLNRTVVLSEQIPVSQPLLNQELEDTLTRLEDTLRN